jgi:hypothetical protein
MKKKKKQRGDHPSVTRRVVSNTAYYVRLFVFAALVFVTVEIISQALRDTLALLVSGEPYRVLSQWMIALLLIFVVGLYATLSFPRAPVRKNAVPELDLLPTSADVDEEEDDLDDDDGGGRLV